MSSAQWIAMHCSQNWMSHELIGELAFGGGLEVNIIEEVQKVLSSQSRSWGHDVLHISEFSQQMAASIMNW